MQDFVFNTVASIQCSGGASLTLHEHCAVLGVSRPLLVTDPGLVAIGLVQPVIEALTANKCAPVLFDQVREDPPEDTVMAAVQLALDSGIDGIIAVGGGSSMDVAKVVAVLMKSEQSLAEIYGVDQVAGGRTRNYGELLVRAATLEALLAATQEAVRIAPSDPFLNGLLVNTLAEREHMLRQISSTRDGGWF